MKKLKLLLLSLLISVSVMAQLQLSSLQKNLIFHWEGSEWNPVRDMVSGTLGTAHASCYNVLGKDGSGRRYIQNAGSTNHTYIADAATYDFGTGDFSLIGSFTPDNITDHTKRIISKVAGGKGYEIYQDHSDIWIVVKDGDGAGHDIDAVIGAGVLVAGTKITAEVVFTRASTAQLYLNGSATATGAGVTISTAEKTIDNAGELVVGNTEDHNNGFSGQIHFVRAFNYALTTQIANYSRPEYPIEAVDRGATGVNLLAGWNLTNWETNATIDNSTTFHGSDFWVRKDGIFESGKKYIMYASGTATVGALAFYNYGIADLYGSVSASDGNWKKNANIYTSTDTGISCYSTGSGSVTISNLAIYRAGCVLDLNAEGLARASDGTYNVGYWTDRTNSITATVSGATVQIPPASNMSGTYLNGLTSNLSWAGMNGLTGDLTIFGKIYPIAFGEGNAGRIIDNSKVVLYTNSTDGKLTFSRDGSTVVSSAAASIAINNPYNYCITSTAAGVTNIYINGVLSGTANQAAGSPASGTTWTIGNNAAGSATFNGNIEGLGIYSRIIDKDQITLLKDTK